MVWNPFSRWFLRRMVCWGSILCGGMTGFCVTLTGLIVFLSPPMDPRVYTTMPRSGEMTDGSGRLLHAFLNAEEQWCFPRTLDDISPHLVHATIAMEDQRFAGHFGIDPIAVCRAALQNSQCRGVASGASTITMQVVKLAGTAGKEKGRRSLRQRVETKLRQAWQAILLERAASKDTILYAYLNKAPYGLNLTGAEAAARRYFGKPASELLLSEAALLAGLPKAPSALEPLSHPAQARARRNRVLDRMHVEGYIDVRTCRVAQDAPLGVTWNSFPRHAPHLAMQLRQRIEEEGILKTTLDEVTQAFVEGLLEKYLKRFDNEVSNAAAIVVDAASASVLARAGSADFFNTPGGGQVDLCSAPRSPGSALKPFTYALAIERNLLYPSEQLLDDTLDFGDYAPGNFNGEYNGLVSAHTALQFSLNVPAVLVLERIGTEALHAFLQGAGISTLTHSPRYYGLGLTLGNCALRLDELTAAYCMLARLGQYRPLRLELERPETAPVQKLSRGTALALYNMMEAPLPTEAGGGVVRAQGILPRVCWKTGTSTGYRDAWSFVFNPQYVVGVWLGNNNARASRRLVGVQAALPLAAAIFRQLPVRSNAVWPEPGPDLQAVRVCSVTGLPAADWCKRTNTVFIPSNQFTNRKCGVHRPGVLEGDTLEHWPGSARGWDLAKVHDAPPLGGGPDKETKEQKLALEILSPAHAAQYVITGEPQGDRLKLAASLDRHLALHWYVDDRFLGTSGPDQDVFWGLESGQHQVACMTAGGETDVVTFEVTSPLPGQVFMGK